MNVVTAGICALLLPSLASCQLDPATREYNTPELTLAHITKQTDAYRGTTTIEGPKQYFDTWLNSGTFVALRTTEAKGVSLTQAYVQLCCEWGFYENAYWEGGEKAEFQKIDSRVEGHGAALETMGVLVSPRMLEAAAASGAGLTFKRKRTQIVDR
jgi:hypothetical protein